MAQPEYPSLSDLRSDLTADDPDERASAYSAVLEADLVVSDVLGQEPPSEELVEAGVIPENDTSNQPSTVEQRRRNEELLTEIRDLLKAQTQDNAS